MRVAVRAGREGVVLDVPTQLSRPLFGFCVQERMCRNRSVLAHVCLYQWAGFCPLAGGDQVHLVSAVLACALCVEFEVVGAG